MVDRRRPPVGGPGPRGARGVGPADREVAASLERARASLAEASLATSAGERYASAHLGALRAAVAVVGARARAQTGRRRGAPRSVWVMLADIAPELGEWARFFAAGAARRSAAEAGIRNAVSAREADDLLRDAETFFELVKTTLGHDLQRALPDHRSALRAG